MLKSTTALQRGSSGAAVARPARQTRVCTCAAQTTTRPTGPTSSLDQQKAEVYIGFEKGDYAPREGRRGRVIIDDLRKYPQRDELCGGWAGGEKGLKAFVADYEREQQLNSSSKPSSKASAATREPKPIAKGSDTIYVGYSKDDLELRKAGAKGRVIKDDARKYPGRSELTGGFAGGELGLNAFVSTGDIPIAEDGQGRRQTSPLVIAGIIALVGTAGGLLVSSLTEVGEQALTGAAGPAKVAVLDETTKLQLEKK